MQTIGVTPWTLFGQPGLWYHWYFWYFWPLVASAALVLLAPSTPGILCTFGPFGTVESITNTSILVKPTKSKNLFWAVNMNSNSFSLPQEHHEAEQTTKVDILRTGHKKNCFLITIYQFSMLKVSPLRMVQTDTDNICVLREAHWVSCLFPVRSHAFYP